MGVKKQPEPCKVVSMMTWKCSIFALFLFNIGANVVEGQRWRLLQRLNDIEERLEELEEHDDHEEGHGEEGHVAVCGYRGIVNSDGTVTYEDIVGENHDDEGLNKDTGIFTAPEKGAYTVSASGSCEAGAGASSRIDMYQDDEEIAGGFVTAITPDADLEWSCSGYRNVDLEEGETLSLTFTRDSGSPVIQDFYFCIHA